MKALAFAAAFFGIPLGCNYTSRKIAEALHAPPQRTLERTVEEAPKIPVPSAKSFAGVSDDVLLGMVVFGEVRGAPAYIQEMVAHTAYNRAGKGKWWGNTLREVLLKPEQYKCTGDHNREKMLKPTAHEPLAVWQRCYLSAQRAASQREANTDLTKGATHFYTTKVVGGKESFPEPRWAKGKTPSAVENWRDSKGRNIRIKFYCLER